MCVWGGGGGRLMKKTILGSHFDYLKPSLIRKVLAIEEIILHPSYVYTGNSYDIALFKVIIEENLYLFLFFCKLPRKYPQQFILIIALYQAC